MTDPLYVTRMAVTVSPDPLAAETPSTEELVCLWLADRARRNGFPWVVFCGMVTSPAEIFGSRYGTTFSAVLYASRELTLP
jgi:hypothetical protein